MRTELVRHFVLVPLLFVTIGLFPGPSTRADIFQWEYIDPSDPSKGKQASSTLAPDGAGITLEPGVYAGERDLTKAYLSGFDLTSLDSHTNLATKSIPPAGRNFLGFFENWYRLVIDI